MQGIQGLMGWLSLLVVVGTVVGDAGCPAGSARRASGAAEQETEYLAVFLDGRKVGHAVHNRSVADGQVTTVERMELSIGRGGTVLPITITETAVETTAGRPLRFESRQMLAAMNMEIAGTVQATGKTEVTIRTGGMTQQRRFDWPQGTLLAEGLRLLALENGWQEGTTYRARTFEASLLRPLELEVRVEGRETVDLLGRVVELTKTTAVTQMGKKTIASTSYVDDEGRALKTYAPVGGMMLELIACSRAFALSENDASDFFAQSLVACPVALGDAGGAKAISYYFRPTDPNRAPGSLGLPESVNQSVRLAQGEAVVTVAPVALPGGVAFPYRGDDPAARAALRPTRFLQCDDPAVIALAKQAVGNAGDAAEAARRIESFVHTYIDGKTLSVGYASALEVARSRQGDCSEHAVLTAALCRAAGIPAQVVMGMVYTEQFAGRADVFAGHAWTRVYLAGNWYDLDATRAPTGYGPRHIALAYGGGSPEDFFALVDSMGQFRIIRVVVRR